MLGILFALYTGLMTMPETVQEYMDNGRAWSVEIDAVYENAQELRASVPTLNSTLTEENQYAECVESVKSSVNSIDGMTYYGDMELTAYVWTGNPCADGVYPQEGYTVACNDRNLWHKWVYIEGYGNYYVHDTGGMASNVIDVYMGDYDSAIQFGRRSAAVYLLEETP